MKKCEAYARKGTGYGICDRPLSELGTCGRASDHVEDDMVSEVRPRAHTETWSSTVVTIEVSIPLQCIDQGSWELTRDQLNHETSKLLTEVYKLRRQQLEAENHA